MTEEKSPSDGSENAEIANSATTESSPASSRMDIVAKTDLRTEFQVPNLIDDELTKQLIARGAGDWPASFALKFFWVMAFLTPPMILSAFFGASFFATFFAVLFFAWLVGTLMARQVTIAMKNRHYAKVVRLLPRTLFWTTMWFPYTYNSHLAASDGFVRLLMLEGRFVEFQAVTLYSWGLIEPQASRRQKSPRNWGVANNLAVALLSQWKFEEAAEVFRDLLKRPADKRAEAILLNNLALCLVRSGELDEADKALTEAEKKASPRVRAFLGWRVDYIRASIEAERGKLTEAEEGVERARQNAIKYKDNLECQPRCDALMGLIRARQGRIEEAELYYKNAIEAMAAANNPSYIALAVYTLEFAALLESQGKSDLAGAERQKAYQFRDLNLLNEMKAVDAIKARLNNKKPIIVPMGLCNLSERDVYLEAIPDFAMPAEDELAKLLETNDNSGISKPESSASGEST